MNIPFVSKNKSGFTLIELLIAVVILGTLSTFAVMSYQSYLIKARRIEAQTGIINLLAQAEQYYLQNNNTYPSSESSLTLPASTYYKFTATSCGTDCLKVTATAQGLQENDTACKVLSIDTKGTRTPATKECWNR